SRRRIDDALHHQRRRLELVLGARSEVVGLESPRDLERAEVAGVDLIERRVPRVARVAAVDAPLAVSSAGLRRRRGPSADDNADREVAVLHADPIRCLPRFPKRRASGPPLSVATAVIVCVPAAIWRYGSSRPTTRSLAFDKRGARDFGMMAGHDHTT